MSEKRKLPKNIHEYISKLTWGTNTALLLCHVMFAVFFYINEIDYLYVLNTISIGVYLLSYWLLKHRKAKTYVYVVFIEMYIFMIISTLCLGWSFGFQHYSMSFLSSLLFADFYLNEAKKIGQKIIFFGLFNTLLYIGLWGICSQFPAVYYFDNSSLDKIFFCINTFLGYAFLILFLCLYSKTVYKLESNLRQMAECDPLTGLYNRRKMLQYLDAATKKNDGTTYAIAMVDVDYFKKVNDTYGHDAGDEVLKLLADILENDLFDEENFRMSRWGGEEFLVLHKCNNDKESVIKTFEELRQHVEKRIILYDKQKIQITITIGLLFFNTITETKELIKEVDDRMYEGKKSGRNRLIYM